MGFDLFGIKPTTKKNKDGELIGEFFRNNVWWFRRLWGLCESIGVLTPEEAECGHSNGGEFIKGNTHKRLLKGLKKAYAEKDTEETKVWLDEQNKSFMKNSDEMDYNGNILPTYQFSWDNVKDFINFMENNKGFQIC